MKNMKSGKPARWLILVFGSTLAVGVFWHGWSFVQSVPQSTTAVATRFSHPHHLETFVGKHVTNAISLTEVELDDGLEVAGLVVNGEPRAYLLEGMSAADHHIANDSVGAESFSVVYCPRSSTVRCLATPKNQQDQLKIKGWFKDSLQLEYQTNQFSIEADSLPLPEMEIAMTSLAAWRQRHPDSKIYLGDFPQVLKAVDPRRSTGDTPRKGTLPRRS